MIMRVASSMVDALRSQPLALALIIINLLFVAAGGYVLHQVGDAVRADRDARNALLAQLAANCGDVSRTK